MVRDRLKELRSHQTNDKNDENVDEKFIITIHEPNSDLDQVYKKVKGINDSITKMSSLVDEMKKIHSTLLSSPIVDEKLKRSLDEINVNFKQNSKQVKDGLRDIQAEITSIDAKGEKNTAAYRIRSTQHAMLQQRVVEVINKYNIAQVEYREKCKERLQRQLEITGRAPNNEELDQMLENPNPDIFIQGIITETKAAKEQLADIQARHQDILKIEKSIRELHEMFMDMAMLVEQQGESINRIEAHVQATYDYVEKAKEQTHQAMEYQKKSRKLKIYIAIIVIIVVLLICYSIFG